MWDARSGQPIGAPLKHEKGVRSAQFSLDGTRVVTASDDGSARVWDARSGQAIGLAAWADGALALNASFSPEGHRIVVAFAAASCDRSGNWLCQARIVQAPLLPAQLDRASPAQTLTGLWRPLRLLQGGEHGAIAFLGVVLALALAAWRRWRTVRGLALDTA